MADRFALSPEVVKFLAAQIGHADLEVYQRNTRWVVRCSCGYISTGRQYPRYAAQAGIHHIESAIKRFRASGRSWPTPSADTPVEDVSESRSSIVA